MVDRKLDTGDCERSLLTLASVHIIPVNIVVLINLYFMNLITVLQKDIHKDE
jgi:hypothetical protein